jgi:alpha-galactosidase
MVDEMVVAQAQWLPQYKDAVPAAKERLAKGTVKTRDWQGAARKTVRSVEELREMKGAHH